MEKCNPIKILTIGLIVYIFLLFISPYRYPIYDYIALGYLILCFLCLYVGMIFIYIIFYLKTKNNFIKKRPIHIYQISKFHKKMIIFIFMVSTIFFLYLSLKMVSKIGTNNLFEASYSDLMAENTSLEKVAQIFLKVPVAVYILLMWSDIKRFKVLNCFVNISLWYYSVLMLIAGRRGEFISTLILFLFIQYLKGSLKKIRLKKVIKSLPIIVIIIILFSLVNTLFKNRGLYGALDLYFLIPNDIVVKPWAKALYNLDANVFDSLYKMLFYYTHSVPWFTYNFNHINYSMVWHGKITFYIISYFLSPFGYNFPKIGEMIKIQEHYGLYNTFVSNFLMDFGKIGTLFFIFFFGMVIMLIYVFSYKYSLFKYYMPVTCLILFVSTIYPISIGGTDFLLLFITVLYFLFRIEIRRGVLIWKKY